MSVIVILGRNDNAIAWYAIPGSRTRTRRKAKAQLRPAVEERSLLLHFYSRFRMQDTRQALDPEHGLAFEFQGKDRISNTTKYHTSTTRSVDRSAAGRKSLAMLVGFSFVAFHRLRLVASWRITTVANIEDFRTNPQIVAGARTGLVAARNHKIASGLPDVALRQVLVERINQWLAAGNLDEFEDLMALAAVCDVNLIAPVVTPDQIHTGGATGTLVAHLHRLAQGIPALPDRQIALEHANAALIAADLDVMQDVLAALAALRA